MLPLPKSFSEKPFHPSGRISTACYIIYYGMKDKEAVFQLPFIAESGKKFCAE